MTKLKKLAGILTAVVILAFCGATLLAEKSISSTEALRNLQNDRDIESLHIESGNQIRGVWIIFKDNHVRMRISDASAHFRELLEAAQQNNVQIDQQYTCK